MRLQRRHFMGEIRLSVSIAARRDNRRIETAVSISFHEFLVRSGEGCLRN